MIIENKMIKVDDECIVNRLYNRFNVLKNHLINYAFFVTRKSGDNIHFDLADVSYIFFVNDGLEIIYRDSGTAFVFFDDVVEFDLILKDVLKEYSKNIKP